MINDIRVASSKLYGLEHVQSQSRNQQDGNFSEIMNMISSNKNEENQSSQINFSSLGAPAGFFADISMLDSEDAKSIGLLDINPYMR